MADWLDAITRDGRSENPVHVRGVAIMRRLCSSLFVLNYPEQAERVGQIMEEVFGSVGVKPTMRSRSLT